METTGAQKQRLDTLSQTARNARGNKKSKRGAAPWDLRQPPHQVHGEQSEAIYDAWGYDILCQKSEVIRLISEIYFQVINHTSYNLSRILFAV